LSFPQDWRQHGLVDRRHADARINPNVRTYGRLWLRTFDRTDVAEKKLVFWRDARSFGAQARPNDAGALWFLDLIHALMIAATLLKNHDF